MTQLACSYNTELMPLGVQPSTPSPSFSSTNSYNPHTHTHCSVEGRMTLTVSMNFECGQLEFGIVTVKGFLSLAVLSGEGVTVHSCFCQFIHSRNMFLFRPSNRVTTSATLLRLIFKRHRALSNTITYLVTAVRTTRPNSATHHAPISGTSFSQTQFIRRAADAKRQIFPLT